MRRPLDQNKSGFSHFLVYQNLWNLLYLGTLFLVGGLWRIYGKIISLQAWRLGMHGGDYAWILPDDTIDLSGTTGDWWHAGPDDCSPSQLSQTMNGMIIVKSHATVFGDDASYSGLVLYLYFNLIDKCILHQKAIRNLHRKYVYCTSLNSRFKNSKTSSIYLGTEFVETVL